MKLLIKFGLAYFVLLTNFALADSADRNTPDSLVTAPVDELTITVSDTSQQLAGIAVTTAQASQYPHEINSYGRAIDPQPLINLHNQYQQVLNELQMAQALLNTTQQALVRYQELYEHGATPLHTLQNQQLQWQTALIQTDAVTLKLKSLQAETLLHWGKELTTWALTDKPSKLDALLNRQATLLQISLPTNYSLTFEPSVIFISPSGDRSNAQRAKLIANVPQNDPNDQSHSYFYETNSNSIKIGMRLSAWIPDYNSQEYGVIVPASALLWSHEHALIYIKINKNLFRQKIIHQFSALNGSYFIANDIKPGEAVVSTGAQMLLSEQLKPKNTEDEND